MGYFPFFMDIGGKCGVIAGGGRVAARKVEKLLAFGPNLTVIAPEIEACIREMKEQLQEEQISSIILQERLFQMSDLAGADFVIAATDDDVLNGRISEYCMAERIPVNVVDDRAKCSFFFPALIQEGDLTIGICTNGKSPAAAAWVRNELSQVLPDGLGKAIDLMGQIRPYIMETDMPESARRDILEKLFVYCIERGGEILLEELKERMMEMQSRASEEEWKAG